jgi:hypothetical protein
MSANDKNILTKIEIFVMMAFMKHYIVRKISSDTTYAFDFLSFWNPLTEEHQFDLADSPDNLHFYLTKLFEGHSLYKNGNVEPQFRPVLFEDLVYAKKVLDIVRLYFIDNNPMTSYGMHFTEKIKDIQYNIVSTEPILTEIPGKTIDCKAYRQEEL